MLPTNVLKAEGTFGSLSGDNAILSSLAGAETARPAELCRKVMSQDASQEGRVGRVAFL